MLTDAGERIPGVSGIGDRVAARSFTALTLAFTWQGELARLHLLALLR